MEGMIDHVCLRVSDLERSRAMYQPALATLGYDLVSADQEDARGYSFARGESDDFAITEPIDDAGRDRVTTGAHVAFRAPDRGAVDAFHAAAVAGGGRDIGAPGPREQYSAGYYGGFVLDPDGNNVEAVFHEPKPAIDGG